MVKKRKSKSIKRDKITNMLPFNMSCLTDYDPDKTEKLKQWCIEQALHVTTINQDGNTVMPEIIRTALKIYDWVTK